MSKNLWKNWRFEPEIIKETPDQSVAVQHTVARQATLLFSSIAEWVSIDHMEQNMKQTLQSNFLLTSCTTTSVPTFSQFLVTTCNKEVRDTHISQCWWTDGAMAMQNTEQITAVIYTCCVPRQCFSLLIYELYSGIHIILSCQKHQHITRTFLQYHPSPPNHQKVGECKEIRKFDLFDVQQNLQGWLILFIELLTAEKKGRALMWSSACPQLCDGTHCLMDGESGWNSSS